MNHPNEDVLSNESNETKKNESHLFNTTPEPSFNSSKSTRKMITQKTHYFCRESHLCPNTKGFGSDSYRINNRARQIAEITLKLFALLFNIFWIIPIKVWGSQISLNKIHHRIFVGIFRVISNQSDSVKIRIWILLQVEVRYQRLTWSKNELLVQRF